MSADLTGPLKILNDLMRPRSGYYWTDLMVCALFGWSGFVLASFSKPWSLAFWIGFLTALFLIYRGSIFIHEVVHFGKKLGRFRFAYDLLFGYPLRYPAYIYDPHLYHHTQDAYGTPEDPEYLPLPRGSAWKEFSPLWGALLLPAAQYLRFVLLPPILLFTGRRQKEWVYQHASTLVVNPAYVRRIRGPQDLRVMMTEDLRCAVFGWAFIGAIVLGILPGRSFVIAWALVSGASLMNMFRAKATHRYEGDSRPMSWGEQLLDSVTFMGGTWEELWIPVGLRYHALHHWIPALPYHSMGEAHRRLLKHLPADHPYRQTFEASLITAFWSRVKACQTLNR